MTGCASSSEAVGRGAGRAAEGAPHARAAGGGDPRHLTALHGHGDYTSAASIKVFTFGAGAGARQRPAVRRAYEEVSARADRRIAAGRRFASRARAAGGAAGFFLLGALNGSTDWYRPGRFDIAALAQEFAALIAAKEAIARARRCMAGPAGL